MRIELNVGPINHKDLKYKSLLKDLQGNILKSNGRDCTSHIFLTFRNDREAIQEAIREHITPMITSAAEQLAEKELWSSKGIDGGLFTNFLLTAKGYRRINRIAVEANSDTAFVDGLKDRGPRLLNDPPVAEWEEPYRNTIHAMVIFADDDRDVVNDATNKLLNDFESILVSHHVEHGDKLTNDQKMPIEHFGYVDGTSQPAFLESELADAHAGGFDKFDASAFLKNVLIKDPNGAGEHSHGSYMVFRKLEQDVQAFRDAELRLANQLGVTGELAGAYAVGRFRDGTPVVLANTAGAAGALNNFDYTSDPIGSKCPFHAHIRKVNPRGDGVLIDRDRRMARRAIPYGGQAVLAAPFPSTGKGLLFMAFMSKIGGATDFEGQTQFEFMQRVWSNNVDFKQDDVGIDPVIGQGAHSDVPKSWPVTWGGALRRDNGFDFGRYVTMKGGEYFFAPSISSMMRL